MNTGNMYVTAVLMFVAVLAMPAKSANAQTATDTFQVSITILDSCSIAANNLDFGSSAALSTNIDVDSTITVNCSVGTSYSVSLDQGVNGTRLMNSGVDNVDYELYTTALRTLPWGTTAGVDTVDGTGTGGDETLTVYGRVPAQTTPPPATYVDTVTATIAF